MGRRTIHLIRHGEVENPDHVVYASLPGFGLSRRGAHQAISAAAWLANRDVATVFSSPLDRAMQTATQLAEPGGLQVQDDDRLTEWALGDRWAGTPWDQLDVRFPGELQAYLDHPNDLAYVSESLEKLAERVADAVSDALVAAPGGEVVLVSHQDPIQACRLLLTSKPLSNLQRSKPGHASIVTLAIDEPGSEEWTEAGYWEPDQGRAFPPIRRPET